MNILLVSLVSPQLSSRASVWDSTNGGTSCFRKKYTSRGLQPAPGLCASSYSLFSLQVPPPCPLPGGCKQTEASPILKVF